MRRLHIHIKVENFEESAKFYTALFGSEPSKKEPGYAKWMLDDPAANIAISARGDADAIDHVGVQVESDDDLKEIADRLKAANASITEEANATCCYARSNKYWALGPEGAVWELFHTFGDSTTYGDSRPTVPANG